jgi:hypothetical protein
MSRRKQSQRARSKSRGRGREVEVQQKNKEQLASLWRWFLPHEGIFAGIQFHGNTKWSAFSLVCLALLWSWSECSGVVDSFEQAVECCRKIFGSCCLSTYQGFMGALSKWTPTLIEPLWQRLHECMEEIGGPFWRIDGWLPLAFDGSRSTAPRTESNERTFCAPNYGRGKTAKYRKKKSKGMRRRKNRQHKPQPQEPQAWITMIWHMGLRLPWRWLLGPSNSSERGHVIQMLQQVNLPKKTLFCADAGFVGYALWSEILNRGGHFLVRVGANVSLLAEIVSYENVTSRLVICWPKDQMRTHAPLSLRLVRVRIGKTRVWMLTSVLNERELTAAQIAKFYKMRWGIEIEFRGLKQTLDRAKLRCRNDQRLLAELNWSILAMAVIELFALKQQLDKASRSSCAKRSPPHPDKRSLANSVRAVRYCLRNLDDRPPRGFDFLTRLRHAVTDDYHRQKPKRARYRPPNPDKKPLGNPKLRRPTPQERKKLREFERKLAA